MVERYNLNTEDLVKDCKCCVCCEYVDERMGIRYCIIDNEPNKCTYARKQAEVILEYLRS